MNIRPKTVRRLAILAAGVVLIALCVVSIWIVHQRNKEKQLLADREFGIAAFKAGDWPLAMERLRVYKDIHPEDYEALYAFAFARSRVPTRDNGHLRQAKQLLEQLNHARPDDIRAAHALLELYSQFAYNREAIELADSILAKDASDVEALRAKSQALARTAKFPEALAISEKLNEVAPLDVSGQIQTFELMRRVGRPAPQVVEHFEALRKAHPDDPRFEILCAYAASYANDQPATLKWLRAAAARPAPDAAFVERLARMFDELKLFDESQALLERAAASTNNPAVLTVLVQRLWQNGRFDDVVTRLKDLDPAKSPADLLALKALSLHQLKRADEADAILKSLSARNTDAACQAWSIALRTRYDSKLDPRAAVTNYEKALARDRENAIIRAWIAESYWRLGELELSVAQWRGAASLMPSWAEPYEMMARALLAQGREQQALDAARAAMRRAPTQVGPAITLALAWNAYLANNPVPADTARLLMLVSQIQKKIPGEPQTLPIYVALQAQTGHADLATQAIRDAVSRPTPPETLVKLLAISRSNNLGVDTQIQEKIGSEENSSPALTFAHAAELARAGKSSEGLALLGKAAASATTQPTAWKLAEARYRDIIGDSGAKDAWVALGDANPNDVAIQSAILNSARAKSDREFFARTIERTRKLTGDEGQLWKLAKARWLLASPDKAKDSAEAVGILSELVRVSPEVPKYRAFLAEGLLNLGNVKDATDHLKAAVNLDPGDLAAVLDLVRLLQNQGRFDEALEYLTRASKDEELTTTHRAQLARAMAQQGATQQALDLLKAGGGQLDASGTLLAAELSRARGQNDEAAALYAKVLADPKINADAIASVADFYASRGKLDEARATLAKLQDPRFAPWQRAIIEARFTEAYGEGADAARKQFTTATQASPDEIRTWRALGEFELRQMKLNAVIAAAERGLKIAPGDTDLLDLKTRATVLHAASDEKADLSPLIEQLSKDPNTVVQADLLRAVQLTRTPGIPQEQLIAQIKALADKHPTHIALQKVLVLQYVSARQFDDAAKVAERLLQARPNEAAPAELATMVYQAAGRWRDMKRSADVWRERSLTNPVPADLAAAEALLDLKESNSALDRLSPYLAQVRSNPAGNSQLTFLLTKVMVNAGKANDARQLLQPMLNQSSTWRQLWLSLAANDVSTPELATDWIKTVSPLIPENSQPEQLALARAWQQLFVRFNDKAAADAARNLLKKLAEKPDADSGALVMLASLYVNSHEDAAAEELYRRALKARADIPEAQNNLAYLLLERGGDLDEAKALALKATSAVPTVADFHDTLARIYLKLGQRTEAIKSFEMALKQDPRNVQSMIGLAGAFSADGRRDKASELLQRIDVMLNGAPPASESLKNELQSLRQQLSRTTG